MRVGIQHAFHTLTQLRRFSERTYTDAELAALSPSELLAVIKALSKNALLMIDAIEKIDRAPHQRIYDMTARAHDCISGSSVDQVIASLATQLRPIPTITPPTEPPA